MKKMGDPVSPRGLTGAQSVSRVLQLLKQVAAAPPRGAGLSDLATASGLPQPTAHRMLAALQAEGFVYQDPALRTYGLGREAYVLGIAAARRRGIREFAEAGLQRIATETGDTAYLSMRSGDDAVCIDRKTGDFPIKILTLEPGHRRPLGLGAGSLALLAFQPAEEIDSILGRNHAGLHPAYPSLDVLREDIATTLEKGYALNPGRIIPEMVGVAVPVLDAQGTVIAALSVAAIRSRLSGANLKRVIGVLSREARQLRADMQAGGTVY
ncbi:helix-turn-helix domain-containing protein [Bordetella sp. 02P26C-1]|nr:helix-turn-helix domain-containing protein [Bordetella sp. 02P26C-1]